MTRHEEEAAWSRMYREIPESEVHDEIRARTRFCVYAGLLILLALVSLIHGLLSIGAAGLEMLQQGVSQ